MISLYLTAFFVALTLSVFLECFFFQPVNCNIVVGVQSLQATIMKFVTDIVHLAPGMSIKIDEMHVRG